jgi:integrase
VEKIAETLPKTLNPHEYDALLKYMIVSLYVLQPPRRNGDYLEMLVVPSYEKSDRKANYLDLSKMEFIYEKYKTSKSYGEQKFLVAPELKQVITLYLKYHPSIPRGAKGRIAMNQDFAVPFLVYADGKPLTAINAITRILNSALGAGIGSTQLRHIYLTSKYGDVEAEKEDDAEAMGHSVGQQGEYIYKNANK